VAIIPTTTQDIGARGTWCANAVITAGRLITRLGAIIGVTRITADGIAAIMAGSGAVIGDHTTLVR
jgi:hypothetical protein